MLLSAASRTTVAQASKQRDHEEGMMVWIADREKSSQFNAAIDTDFLFLVALQSLVDGGGDEPLRFQSTVEEKTTEARVPPSADPVRVTLVQPIAVPDNVRFCSRNSRPCSASGFSLTATGDGMMYPTALAEFFNRSLDFAVCSSSRAS